ncbi:MAG: DJ-1/PfpI family protein, partial [Candidatus Parcubacteria bacterium]|nr:DJ-1/PfpI family protein [Candidatus Parcubacteria bacterium]
MVLIIIAFRDFKDEEYFRPREILEKNNISVKTASTERGLAIGVEGGEVEIDFLVSEINLNDFDAVVFVGGPGALKYLDNNVSYEIAQKTIAAGKILAAICISPVILAKAGVLKNKKATVWSSELDKSPIKILKQNNAIYEDKPVILDAKILTANGPSAAAEFGEK